MSFPSYQRRIAWRHVSPAGPSAILILVTFLCTWMPAGGRLVAADDGTPQAKQAATDTTPAGDSEPARVSGGEVVVTAPRIEVPLKENPAATTVVTGDQLAAMPKTIAADEALKLVPGVKVDNQADGERVHMSIRGQGILTERGIRGIKVLLDGLPLNDPTGFAPDLFDVDWATVSRIEVLRGPVSALYGGGGAGGVLNIETAGAGEAPLAGRASLDVGSYGFGKALVQASGHEGRIGFRASASRTTGDGYRVHTAYDATNAYAKIDFRDAENRLTAIVAGTSFFNQNAEGLNIEQVNEDPRQANPDALTYNEYQKTRRGTAGLVGRFGLAPGQELSFAAYLRETEWRESVPSSVDRRTYDSPGGYLQYSWTTAMGSLRNQLQLGADLDAQRIDDTKRPNQGAGIEGPVVVADQNIDQRGVAFNLLDRVELSPQWSVIAGVRSDDIDNTLTDNLKLGGVDLSGDATFRKTTGRLGVAWNPLPDLGAYASWGQGFLPPATEELANNPEHLGGFNESLVPATSHGVEAGVRGALPDAFTYDVAVFHLLTDGDFGRYRVPTRPLETFYDNAGDSRRWGLETLLSWYPIRTLQLQLAYTYSHFTYDNVTFNNMLYYGTWLPNSPQHQAYLDAGWRLLPDLTLGGAVELLTRSYIDASNTTWTGGYTLLHLRLAWSFRLWGAPGELQVAARNLTDKHYIAFTEPDPDGNSYHPAAGRELFAGVSVNL
jgi:iron complex outermembrane recepter protein